MRLKTFLATYLLFVCILFLVIGTVSYYMTNSQMTMLREKSTREYQRISASLARDISVLYNQRPIHSSANITDAIDSLVRGYSRYYQRYNIRIQLTELQEYTTTTLSFVQLYDEHYIHIVGALLLPVEHFQLDYYINITQSIADLRNIQQILLTLSLAFLALAAVGLYFILMRIFKPLAIVANTSREIANGNYGERIRIKGRSELSKMADNFNQMAEEIESQFRILKEEAVGKQQFIDNFSHEIRSPLTSIYGFAEYLQKAAFDEGANIKATQIIMDEAKHMKAIATSLLELATLRNYVPIMEKIALTPLFNDVKETLQIHAIKFDCEANIEYITGQEDLIRSLIVNLCQNAIKACPAEGGIVRLAAMKQDDKVELHVTDNGRGIAAEDITKITEPFYRADKARSRSTGNAGLGLTLCKQIADVHKAEMVVESIVGSGTTVKIKNFLQHLQLPDNSATV